MTSRVESKLPLRSFVVTASFAALALGAAGMVLSFAYMNSTDIRAITAGASGFVAGALFVFAGLLSLAIVTTRPSVSEKAT